MRRYFSLALRRFGLLSFDLLVSQVSQYPSNKEIPPGELWLVVDSGIKKWACLNCPGGCGVQISLSLNPDRRPRWTINQDLWGRPTVSPSIHQQKKCNCHFWIQKGRIVWCK